jgi:hypothetical protein
MGLRLASALEAGCSALAARSIARFLSAVYPSVCRGGCGNVRRGGIGKVFEETTWNPCVRKMAIAFSRVYVLHTISTERGLF